MFKRIALFILLSINLFATPFTIGTTSGYAPFVSLDEKGAYTIEVFSSSIYFLTKFVT